MLVVWGTRLFAKVDRVPGVLHVKTLFFHISFVPLFPRGSYVIAEEGSEGGQLRGAPIPTSWKSLLVAWARVLTTPLGVVGLVLMLVRTPGAPVDWAAATTGFVLSAGVLALFVFPGRIKPSFERARALGDALGLYEHEWARMEALYRK